MDWQSILNATVGYIENNLTQEINVHDVAKSVYVSPYFLQRIFSVVTGFGIGEYIRNRRLYESALEIANGNGKITDISYKYCYDTPESFSKAFSRFHGKTPKKVRELKIVPKEFLPLKINFIIQGASKMNYKITKMFPLKVIGFQKVFNCEDSYEKIPLYWDEICEKYANNVYAGNPPANAWEKALIDNCIGEYGVCIDDLQDGKFRYLIAGKYCGGEVPEGMVLYEFPAGEWAIFDCIGPMPKALQEVNTHIFKEWLPNNLEYEMAYPANIEWYDCANGEKTNLDYHSAIWIPVRKK